VLLRAAAAAATLILLTACGGPGKKAGPPSQLPPGCSVAEVERIVTDFLASPSFAPAREFDVYASYESDGRKHVYRSARRAAAYLRARLASGERQRLIELRVGKEDFNHARITFRLTRYAPDFRARGIRSRLAQGAGTVDCAHGEIAAWVVRGP